MLRFSEATRCRHLRYQGRAQNSTGVSAVVPTEPTYDRLHGRAMVSWVVSRRSSCQQPVPVPTMPPPGFIRNNPLPARLQTKRGCASQPRPALEVLCVFRRTGCRPHSVIQLLHKYTESAVTGRTATRHVSFVFKFVCKLHSHVATYCAGKCGKACPPSGHEAGYM